MPDVTKTHGVEWPLRVGPPSLMPRMNWRSWVKSMAPCSKSTVTASALVRAIARPANGDHLQDQPPPGYSKLADYLPTPRSFCGAARLVFRVNARRLQPAGDGGRPPASCRGTAPRHDWLRRAIS